MRRDHSRTFVSTTNLSRSRAISTNVSACATNTAASTETKSLPKSDLGQSVSSRQNAARPPAPATGVPAISLDSIGLDADADDIALPVDRLDDGRRARIIAEDLPQPAHAHIDAAVER